MHVPQLIYVSQNKKQKDIIIIINIIIIIIIIIYIFLKIKNVSWFWEEKALKMSFFGLNFPFKM